MDMRKRVGSGIAAIAIAVGAGVVGVAAPAQAASWHYTTHGAYLGPLACTSGMLQAQKYGQKISRSCYRVGDYFYFQTRIWY